MSDHYIYILASQRNGTIYVGVTTDLKKRVWQHKNKVIKGFTEKYNVHHLVYFEHFEDYWEAGLRERRLKKWKRKWKLELIEQSNPNWNDLYETL